MTTLYRPVLIEYAEQAEAFPVGTLVSLEDRLLLWTTDMKDNPGRMVGWTALVPIEAEEDFQKAGGASVYDGGMGSWPDRTRLVTPWEEA